MDFLLQDKASVAMGACMILAERFPLPAVFPGVWMRMDTCSSLYMLEQAAPCTGILWGFALRLFLSFWRMLTPFARTQ